MPALGRARKQAKAVAGRMNLRQWGLIWSIYTGDNDGYFSTGIDIIDSGGKRRGWYRGQWIIALRPHYETRSDILRCPMATKRRPDGRKRGAPFNTYVMGEGGPGDLREEASYGINCWVYNPPTMKKPGSNKIREYIQKRPVEYNWRTANVRGGNKIPVFADTMWRGGGPFYKEKPLRIEPPIYHGQWSGAKAEMHHFCIDRHDGGINVLFLDSAVRKVELKELWKLKWHRQFDTNGLWTLAGGVTPNDWPQWMRRFKDY